MAQAKRDENFVPTLIGVSNSDGITPITVYVDPVTHRMLVSAGTATPGGLDTQVQFNDAGTIAGDAGLTYNKTTDALSVNGGILPISNDTGAIGSATLSFSDLYLASGALLNFANGNSVITHSSGILTVSTGDLRVTTAGTNSASVVTVGGTQTLTNKTLTSPVINTGTIGTSLLPTSNDGAPLGDTTHNFSDLFLASGAVINYANSDVVITHTSGILTMGTGEIRITTVGTNAASVITVGSTSTLTNKTLTSPTLTTPVLGTPSSGNLTNCTALPVSGITASTVTALGVGSIELGHATDTTIARVGAGQISVEGVNVVTISSSDTLTNKTLTSPTIQTSPVIAAATQIKLTVPTGDGTATGEITNEFNSGYSSTAVGDLVYLDSSATWQKADADLSAAAYASMLGIALSVTASASPATVLLRGFVYGATPFPTFTIGGAIYMSTTAAAVTQTAPSGTDSATRIVGFGVHADKMYFNPSNDYLTHT